MTRRWSACLTLLLLSAITASSADAEESASSDRIEARDVFEQGMAARSAGDYEAAAAAFEQSYQLYPHPGTLLNLAVDLDRGGRLREAYHAWRELRDRFGAVISDDAREQAHERLEQLERTLALVELQVEPPGAVIEVDGVVLGPAPLEHPLVLAPGTHRISADAPGHEGVSLSRRFGAGRHPPLRLELQLEEQEPTRGPTTGHILVTTDTPRARATVDGGDARPTPARFEVTPGEHVLRLRAPAMAPLRRSVDVEAGAEVLLELTLDPLLPAPAFIEPTVRRRAWPWVLVTTIVVGVGLGLGLGFGLQEDLPTPQDTIEIQ